MKLKKIYNNYLKAMFLLTILQDKNIKSEEYIVCKKRQVLTYLYG